MRLTNLFGGVGATALAAMAAPMSLAQGLEIIGQPHDKLLGFQPASSSLAVEQQWLDHMILYIITVIVIFVCGAAALCDPALQQPRQPDAAPVHPQHPA
jgi:cytochrome c oxidase subunit 2